MYPRTIWPERATAETLELRDVINSGVDIWDFDYPSYYKGDEKKAFEQKVIDHFYTRQIGQETVGRFLLYFRRTVREIMPYYIQRYQSVDLMNDPEIKPLDNYNMIEEYTSESSETSTGSATVTNSGTNSETASETKTDTTTGTETRNDASGGLTIRHDTPQNTLSIPLSTSENVTLTHASELEQNRGLTDSSLSRSDSVSSEGTSERSGTVSSDTSSSENNSGTGTEKHKLTRRGNIGVTTYAQLLEGLRQTFINIDMEIIGELENCFLGVY